MSDARILVAVASAGALASCFSPSYGPGGFLCSNGECPEGYACVVEGSMKVCRRGASSGDLAADRARVDGISQVDGIPRVDRLLDKPKGEAGPAGCGFTEVIPGTGAVPKLALSFDLATDGSSQPHVVYVDPVASGILQQTVRLGGKWVTTQVKTTVSSPSSQVAIAVDPADRLHVVRRGMEGGNQRLFHVWRNLSTPPSTWQVDTRVSPSLDVSALDVAAAPSGVYLVASGKDGMSGSLSAWVASLSGASYAYKPLESHPELSDARVGAGANLWSFSGYGAGAVQWQMRSGPSGLATSSQQTQNNIVNGQPMPAPVAVDASGGRHYAYVRSQSGPANLSYLSWAAGSSIVAESNPGSSAAAPASLDIALDSTGKPCISFSESGQVRVLCSTGGTWKQKTSVPASAAFTRLAVAKNGWLYVVYLASGPNELRASCILP